MKRVLETVLKNGAVIAEPGEFTKRAFPERLRRGPVSGRGSYGCHSGKEFHGTQKFCRTVKGSVQRAVKEIRARLLHQIAYIETALDDPEHF